MSTIRNIIVILILAVLLRDVLVKIPGFVIGAIDTIGRMPAKSVAIIILAVAGIFIAIKGRK